MVAVKSTDRYHGTNDDQSEVSNRSDNGHGHRRTPGEIVPRHQRPFVVSLLSIAVYFHFPNLDTIFELNVKFS